MPWYDEHIEYGEDTLRPYLKETGYEIHKIIKQVENGMIPQEVVQRYYDLNDFLDGIEDDDIESEIDVQTSEGFELPDFDVTHVEAAIDFARDNEDMIEKIQEEQEDLTDTMLEPPEEAYKQVNELDLEYFNVTAELGEKDGETMVDFDYEQ